MHLIVGLGNPGKEYEKTRHNLGFMAVQSLAGSFGIDKFKNKSELKAEIAETLFNGGKIVLSRPQTFMNLSGEAVKELMRYYRIEPAHLIVIHDDLDLDKGTIRIRMGGGSAGHRGVESIIKSIASKDFIRIRIGIGRPAVQNEAAVTNYVLSYDRDYQESEIFAQALLKAEEALRCMLEKSLPEAMNKYNQ